jgi:excisionase family DNA binding protein
MAKHLPFGGADFFRFLARQGVRPFIMSNIRVKPAAEAVKNSALLTKRQAADYLQVTPRYIERAVISGRLKALKPTGGLWRVRQSELDAFLKSGATIGGGE